MAAGVVPSQVTEPLKRPRGKEERKPQHRWCLNLHPQEGETSSKTGTWDETVELCDTEDWEWLEPLLTAGWSSQVRRARAQHEAGRLETPLLGVEQRRWALLVAAAARRLGVPADQVVHLYRLRHGGASHDAASRSRSLTEVRKRGSWRSAASVARYAKPGRVNEQISKLPAPVRKEVERRAARLSKDLLAALSRKR